jgi:hypothetical protein
MATSINSHKVASIGDLNKGNGSTVAGDSSYAHINTEESSSQVAIDIARFNQN